MSIPNHLSEQLLQLKSEQEIKLIIQDQDECLQIYKDTQQKLDAFNKYSRARYIEVHKHFEMHTKLLKQVKHDLDGVFTKLRTIKTQLSLKYPEEMQLGLAKYPQEEEEEE